jgi:hypothetical protein
LAWRGHCLCFLQETLAKNWSVSYNCCLAFKEAQICMAFGLCVFAQGKGSSRISTQGVLGQPNWRTLSGKPQAASQVGLTGPKLAARPGVHALGFVVKLEQEKS